MKLYPVNDNIIGSRMNFTKWQMIIMSNDGCLLGWNPLDCCNFICSFENLIESKTDSASSRLHFLVQYTSGNVKDLMQSCLTMDSESSSRRRYGQEYKIAAAHVERTTQGPPIRSEDTNSLQRLSVLLTSCRNTLENIDYVSKINW